MGGKGYGIAPGAPGDRRIFTRWCAFGRLMRQAASRMGDKRLEAFASTCGNLLVTAL